MDIGGIGVAAAFALAALGSALGTGTAGMAAIGAWKKCFVQNKAAPFILLAFVGAPLSQTFYGFILMSTMITSSAGDFGKLGVGVLGGMTIGFSAWFQGKAGASASDAIGETGKGFANFIAVIGVIESVALFAMVLLLISVNSIK
jgi:V/A-type H+-transporting ATPase subunit K